MHFQRNLHCRNRSSDMIGSHSVGRIQQNDYLLKACRICIPKDVVDESCAVRSYRKHTFRKRVCLFDEFWVDGNRGIRRRIKGLLHARRDPCRHEYEWMSHARSIWELLARATILPSFSVYTQFLFEFVLQSIRIRPSRELLPARRLIAVQLL